MRTIRRNETRLHGPLVVRRGAGIAYMNKRRTLVDLTVPFHGQIVLLGRGDLEDLKRVIDTLLGREA